VIGHLLHGVRLPRQPAEQRGKLAVHALGDPRRVLQQLVGRLRIEPRIRAQHGDERLERTGEPHAPHDGAHLRFDTRDFGET
jgi:hypothetical protein